MVVLLQWDVVSLYFESAAYQLNKTIQNQQFGRRL